MATIVKRLLRKGRELSDWRSLPFYAQRQVTGVDARRRLADFVARTRPHSSDPGAIGGAVAIADTLRAEGLCFLPSLLSDDALAQVRAYLARHQVHDPYRPELGAFDPAGAVPPQTHVAHYSPEIVLACPALLDIANDPRLLAALELVLGCKPTLSYLAIWWSFAGDRPGEHAELFHRDVDDVRFIKLFAYLTDVDEGSGPHVFVTRSHLDDKLRPIRRYTDDEVREAYPSQYIRSLTGKAGTCFLENTEGLHKGQPALRTNRLLFQAVYSVLPMPYGPRHPIAELSRVSLDPYVNRVYLKPQH